MKKKTPFDSFKDKANAYLKEHYGSTLADLMIGDDDVQRAFDNKETPKQYIDWMANKYGFIKTKDWTFEKASRVMKPFMQ